MSQATNPADAPRADHPYIDTTDETFERDVIERSRSVPVVVDFWAEWCAPCRALGPMLERIAAEQTGKFVLVKANFDQTGAAASAMGVQSIPAVYGFRDGVPVDAFVGALPEPQFRVWLSKLLPSEAEQLVSAADALTESDPDAAEAQYRKAMALDEASSTATIRLAELLAKRGEVAEARTLIDALAERGYLEPAAEKVRTTLDLAKHAADGGGLEKLRTALAAEPTNRKLSLQLAEALAAAGQYPEALDLALAVVEQGGETKDAGRLLMIDIFRLLPEESPLISDYRRRLSSVLY